MQAENQVDNALPAADTVREYFSGLSQQYSSCFLPSKTGTNFSFRQRLRIAMTAANGVSGRVMDCATGSGEILAAILSTGKFTHATILDLSPKMLELASRQIERIHSAGNSTKAELVCDDVFHFARENANAKHNLIICLGLIAHTGRLPELLGLLQALLTPDGIIMLQTTLLDHPCTRLTKLFLGRRSKRKHGYSISYFHHQDIETACVSAGLKIANCHRYTLGIPFGDRIWAWGNYQMEKIFQRWASKNGSEAIYILKVNASS